MKTLYVVTHPQSIHHVEKKVGGWYDTSLTDLGHRQAKAIAARLTALCADTIRASPHRTCCAAARPPKSSPDTSPSRPA